MNIDQIFDEIINNSKYSSISTEQKTTLKNKLVQKYMNDLNYTALEMLSPEKKEEFSKILAGQNQSEIEEFLALNISDLNSLIDKTSAKYVEEVTIYFQD